MGNLYTIGIMVLFLLIPLKSFASELKTEERSGAEYFRIKPGSNEWKSFKNPLELVDALNLPEETLSKISTKELLDISLSYPLLKRFGNFNNIETGFKNILEEFNGFQELLKRDDCATVISDYYLKYDKAVDKYEELSYIELLLSQLQIIQNVKYEIILEILKESYKVYDLKVKDKQYSSYRKVTNSILMIRSLMVLKCKSAIELYADYEFRKKLFHGTLSDSEIRSIIKLLDKVLKDNMIEVEESLNIKELRNNRGDTIIYTPNSSEVKATVYHSEPSNKSDLDSYTKYNEEHFPELKLIGPATGKYNCHSFAWYIHDTTNNCWINKPENFWLDESFVETSDLEPNCYVVYFGPKMVEKDTFMIIEILGEKDTIPYTITVEDTSDYSNPLHSAIYKPDEYIKSIPEGHPVVSKWGQSPLYAHALKYVDPSYDTTHMKYYVENGGMIIKDKINDKLTTVFQQQNKALIIQLDNVKSKGKLELFSINGKRLKFYSINLLKHQRFDLSNLSKGIYLVKLKVDEFQQSMRFIVN